MKWIVYAIAAAVIIVLRITRRARGGRRLPVRAGLGAAGRALGRHNALGDTGLVAGREIRERLRGRSFKVISLVLLGVVAAAIVIPTLHSSSRSAVKVGLVGSPSSGEAQAVGAALAHAGVKGPVVSEHSIADARSALRSHHVTVAVVGGSAVLVDIAERAGATTAAARVATVIAQALGVRRAFHAAGLSPSQAATVAQAKPLPIHSVATRQGGAVRGASVIGLVFIFILLTQYLTWTLVGVMEEKSSRVVEVLLATVRPVELLGGKVLGIGAVALLQAGVVVAFALGLGDAVGSNLLQGTAPMVVAASLVWLVLAYAFYSWVFAAAGSMAERQDQAQSLSLPLSVPIILGYVVSLASSGPGPASLFVKVLAYLPPTAPFAMPLLVAKGEVAWWGFVLAALVSVACTVAVARFASTVYRRAVLRTGRRLRVRDVVTLTQGS